MSERYHPSADQLELARALGESLASLLPLSRLRDANEESADTWRGLSALGVLAIATPEVQGGSGLGASEEALIALELGRRAVAPSVLATIGATHLRAAQGRVPADSARRVAAGYRHGGRVVFIEDTRAELLLVRGESAAGLFPLPGTSRLVDEQLWSCRLRETVEVGSPLAEAVPAEVVRLRLIDAAVLAGLARAALEMAVEYAGLREQFGRPIGSFQAVKHLCADMALAARCAGDQVSFAAVAIDDGRDDAVLQVESALFVAGSAALGNCGKNIQVHGGIGFSDEAAPHRLLKRAHVFLANAGGLEAALARIADCPPSATPAGAQE